MKNTLSIPTILLGLLVLFYGSAAYAQDAARLVHEAMELKKEGKDLRAQRKLEDALAIAEQRHQASLQMKCHLELAELKSNVVNYKKALAHYRAFSVLYRQQLHAKNQLLKDSVEVLKTEVDSGEVLIEQGKMQIARKEQAIDSLTTEQLRSALIVKDLELQNQRVAMKLTEAHNRRNVLLLISGMIGIALLFTVVGYFRKRSSNSLLRQKNEEILHEKERSDSLLRNILPESVANELKGSGKTTPARFEQATVMFTDFKGFTQFAGENPPEAVVAMLDFYFRAFDTIIANYPIEKIKTIGDAYLCVSGVPEPHVNHAEYMLKAALEFQDFVRTHAISAFGPDAALLEMRIGIHSGPLVAGVVGSTKFAYDVWGDTVNVAARMEQSGASGKINVSETVVEACKDQFHFVYRGELEAKNKGKLKMYFLEGKPA